MISTGVGVKDEHPFDEITFRLILHSVIDTDSGFTPNS